MFPAHATGGCVGNHMNSYGFLHTHHTTAVAKALTLTQYILIFCQLSRVANYTKKNKIWLIRLRRFLRKHSTKTANTPNLGRPAHQMHMFQRKSS